MRQGLYRTIQYTTSLYHVWNNDGEVQKDTIQCMGCMYKSCQLLDNTSEVHYNTWHVCTMCETMLPETSWLWPPIEWHGRTFSTMLDTGPIPTTASSQPLLVPRLLKVKLQNPGRQQRDSGLVNLCTFLFNFSDCSFKLDSWSLKTNK